MAYLIILRGRTSGGKSTLMKRLVEELDFRSIDHDTMAKEFEEQIKDSEGLHREIGRKANDIIKHGNDLVVEGPFHKQFMTDNFFEYCGRQKIDKNVVIIRLECSLETALLRNHGRAADEVDEEKIRIAYENELLDVEGEQIFNTDNGIDNVYNYINNIIDHD